MPRHELQATAQTRGMRVFPVCDRFVGVSPDPNFEVYRKSDKNIWAIMVTWGHTLRHEIPGLVFSSEKAGIRWIEHQSPLWVAAQNGPCSSGARRRDSRGVRHGWRDFVSA